VIMRTGGSQGAADPPNPSAHSPALQPALWIGAGARRLNTSLDEIGEPGVKVEEVIEAKGAALEATET
jgi:hypothetical protein